MKLLDHLQVSAVSVVYNFRVAQITRQPIAQKNINHKPNTLSLLLFDFFQKTRCFDIRENYAGGLATYSRNFSENYYFRTDFATASAHQTVKKIETANVIESDDILFTVERNILQHEQGKVSVCGLLGIPTHSVYTLQRVGIGTGQVGLGAQLDGLYKLAQNCDFLCGARYVYFIPRNAIDNFGNSYKFTIGSIADLLLALQTNRTLGHNIEGGYAVRWGFDIHATPAIPELNNLNYTRNNFYLVYKYTFLKDRFAHRFLFNISYGFDSKPKKIGYNAVMVWGSWGIAF